jgi:hypothetical protein
VTTISGGQNKDSKSPNNFKDSLADFAFTIWQKIEDPLRTTIANFIITFVILISGWLLWKVAIYLTGDAISTIPIVKDIMTWAEIVSAFGTAALFVIDTIATILWTLKKTPELEELYQLLERSKNNDHEERN